MPWIPVLYLDGRRAALSLQHLLEDAHLIREIEADPAQWAALMRFLPSVVALVARQDPGADFDTWAVDGLPPVIVDRALDALADRLWLRHPETPFMQEPLLVDEGKPYSTEWLHLTAPGPNSKAWWGKPGDHVRAGAATPAHVALGLVTSWYFNPGIGGKAVGHYADDESIGWRPRGTLGFHNHGVRVFHRGPSLAATLLANTMDAHVSGRGKNLPLWASGPDTLPAAGPLTASTWTGSVYRLLWNESTPTGVIVGGRRHHGASAEKKDRDARTAAIEKGLWRADPTIPRLPVVKAGEETGEVRPLPALHPAASAVEWAAEWYVTDARRGAVRELEPGLIDAGGSDIFVIRMDGPSTAREISHIGRIGERSDITSASARSRLVSLSALVLRPIRTTLYVGLVKALGQEAAQPLHDRLHASFCAEAEDTLDELIHAPELTIEHAQGFTRAAATAFERFLTPYLNSQTLAGTGDAEGIAAGLAFVRSRIASTLREVHA